MSTCLPWLCVTWYALCWVDSAIPCAKKRPQYGSHLLGVRIGNSVIFVTISHEHTQELMPGLSLPVTILKRMERRSRLLKRLGSTRSFRQMNCSSSAAAQPESIYSPLETVAFCAQPAAPHGRLEPELLTEN